FKDAISPPSVHRLIDWSRGSPGRKLNLSRLIVDCRVRGLHTLQRGTFNTLRAQLRPEQVDFQQRPNPGSQDASIELRQFHGGDVAEDRGHGWEETIEIRPPDNGDENLRGAASFRVFQVGVLAGPQAFIARGLAGNDQWAHATDPLVEHDR